DRGVSRTFLPCALRPLRLDQTETDPCDHGERGSDVGDGGQMHLQGLLAKDRLSSRRNAWWMGRSVGRCYTNVASAPDFNIVAGAVAVVCSVVVVLVCANATGAISAQATVMMLLFIIPSLICCWILPRPQRTSHSRSRGDRSCNVRPGRAGRYSI